MLGSLVALNVLPSLGRPVLKGAISFLGLVSVLYAVFAYSRSMAFPGLAALVPTLGTAAFIYAESEETTWVGRLLARREVVSVGLICTRSISGTGRRSSMHAC